jgi:hypothetical protein
MRGGVLAVLFTFHPVKSRSRSAKPKIQDTSKFTRIHTYTPELHIIANALLPHAGLQTQLRNKDLAMKQREIELRDERM